MSGEACACRIVEFDPVKNDNGTCTDRWRCHECGGVFVRAEVARGTVAEVEAIKEVARAARQLEFVALTPGPHVEGDPPFETLLMDMILYDAAGGDVAEYTDATYRERLDAARRERIRWAWSKLRHVDGARRGGAM